jgi:hypothetical protein
MMQMDIKRFKVILWGLTNKRDSFRFIHAGFYDALKYSGVDVEWVADHPRNFIKLNSNTLVIAVDVDCKNLPFHPEATYVTLNILENSETGLRLLNSNNWFRIQEYTNSSHGLRDSEGSITRYRPEKKTLYMPWGTPWHEKQFMHNKNDATQSKNEYWVGAIWNDALNQGNIESITTYRKTLGEAGVKFKRVGGSRFRIGGLSEIENARKVQASRLGAAIVGNWQQTNEYYPCRLFKAVSAGIPPTSNLDARPVFGDTLLFSENIETLTHLALDESEEIRRDRAAEAQKMLRPYTYIESYKRILRMVNFEW